MEGLNVWVLSLQHNQDPFRSVLDSDLGRLSDLSEGNVSSLFCFCFTFCFFLLSESETRRGKTQKGNHCSSVHVVRVMKVWC